MENILLSCNIWAFSNWFTVWLTPRESHTKVTRRCILFYEIFGQRKEFFPKSNSIIRWRKRQQKINRNMENIHEYLCCQAAAFGIEHFGGCWCVFIGAALPLFFHRFSFGFSPAPLLPFVCSAFTHVSERWLRLLAPALAPWRCFMWKVTNAANTTRSRFIWTLAETGSGHQNGEILNIYQNTYRKRKGATLLSLAYKFRPSTV